MKYKVLIGGNCGKKGSIINEAVIHVILISLILVVFLFATAGRINGRDVKQQILEKQLALLIDSSEAGFSFEIYKKNVDGLVDSVEVRDGRIFIGVSGFPSSKGYPYFSKYLVSVDDVNGKFVVRIEK